MIRKSVTEAPSSVLGQTEPGLDERLISSRVTIVLTIEGFKRQSYHRPRSARTTV